VKTTSEIIVDKFHKLEKERDELLEILEELEEACNSSSLATIYDAPCRVRARELISKIKGE
jgi:transcriptional regulator of NAD metabolism